MNWTVSTCLKICDMDDIDKELKALFDSPLLDMSPGELALFDVPEHLGKKKEIPL